MCETSCISTSYYYLPCVKPVARQPFVLPEDLLDTSDVVINVVIDEIYIMLQETRE